jgi:hypothetical protein
LAANDFRALFHIKVAENSGVPLTAGDLRQRMGVSGGAITSGGADDRIGSCPRIRSRRQAEGDPAGRRPRVACRPRLFTPLAEHTRQASADVSNDDLAAAHRTFTAVIDAMRAFRDELDAMSG